VGLLWYEEAEWLQKSRPEGRLSHFFGVHWAPLIENRHPSITVFLKKQIAKEETACSVTSLTQQRQAAFPTGNPALNCLPCPPMARETLIDSRQEILRTAGRLFQQRGYDATSMNDVAAALKLSKGGLYHHFQSKDEILYEIMNHAMDITQERVIDPVRRIADPEQALRALIRLHIEVVLSPRDREITVMLHENHPLPPTLRRKINARKKGYVHFLEDLMAEVQRTRRAKGGVSPRAAAFALLGMINWIYQWYKPEGELQVQNLVPQFTDFVFGGILM
jgi:TetR/AcrR family transcriptional regulator, cholesterol catabolism regulator